MVEYVGADDAVSAPRSALAVDAAEFVARLDEHRGIVFKVASLYADRDHRDDLVQEIGLQLWRAYPRYDRERRFSTWMYRVALNTAISFGRTRWARERRAVGLDEPVVEAMAAPPPAEPDARLDALFAFLRGLPEMDRALVLLHLEDRSHREIAEVLGISETNVGTKLSRIKQAMRRDLAADKEN